MATSKVQIANLALMHVGENAITSFADETNAARAIDQVYDVVRDAVLTDHTWNLQLNVSLYLEIRVLQFLTLLTDLIFQHTIFAWYL